MQHRANFEAITKSVQCLCRDCLYKKYLIFESTGDFYHAIRKQSSRIATT